MADTNGAISNQRTEPSGPRGFPHAKTDDSAVPNEFTKSAKDRLRVLVIEDELEIRRILRELLEAQGFEVEALPSGNAIIHQLELHRPHVLLVDQMMPGLSGTEVIQMVRGHAKFKHLAILMVTALTGEDEKVFALDRGADDYVTKPFQARELGARIQAVARRSLSRQNSAQPWPHQSESSSSKNTEDGDPLFHGPLRLDARSFRAFMGEDELHLTLTEYMILRELMRQKDGVLTRKQLCDRVLDSSIVSDRTIDVHMASIRRKMGEQGDHLIETVRGVGYRMGQAQSKS